MQSLICVLVFNYGINNLFLMIYYLKHNLECTKGFCGFRGGDLT
jgi:hypothetical protein